MSLPVFLPQVDSDDLTTLQALARLGPVLVPASKLAQVKAELPASSPYYVEVAKDSEDDLISYLDQGAHKIVVSRKQLEALGGQVTEDKLILAVAESEVSSLADKTLLASVSSVLVELDAETDSIPSKDAIKSRVPGYAKPTFFRSAASLPSATSVELIRSLYPASSTIVLSTSALSISPNSSDSKLSIVEAFLAPINSDRPDGLFPTVVSSYLHTSRSLGLVYSSRESIAESINTGKGVYQSRKHGLWRKGETSGAVQEVVSIRIDCDADALEFSVIQHGTGFCHLGTATCFGSLSGIGALEETLQSRFKSAPEGSYTRRLFNDEQLLRSKIMEEAEELCDAQTKDEVAFEAADLVYFALTRCVSKGVSLADVERALDKKARKVTRRKGDAKPKWDKAPAAAVKPESKPAEPVPQSFPEASSSSSSIDIRMRTSNLATVTPDEYNALLRRPVIDSLSMIDKVKPIVQRVRSEGDKGLLALTAQFDKAEMDSTVILPPFAVPGEDVLPSDVRKAIDQAYANVKTFHVAQAEKEPLVVETMPGVVCSRFVRAISRVGVYVPGGTAVLPSTAIMLGVPAQVAGCKEIVLATPPRKDGSISPEVLYVAGLVGATCILKAGGAQAVGAMAYGTESVPKVDKIFGPGNQWVTAAKMLVQNDTEALVAIDMPAGPSEVLVSHPILSFSADDVGHCRSHLQSRFRCLRSLVSSGARHRFTGRPSRYQPYGRSPARDRTPGRRPGQGFASSRYHSRSHQEVSDRDRQDR